jgi:tetratricopeptide (TPR) repeat protein
MTFHNPQARQREGRFEITLPPGAAVSRFAMKIRGAWQEAEVVERQRARVIYEDFLHQRQDPALLEKKAGDAFRARVFPIPPKGDKEILISYSHELPGHADTYRLPLVGLPKIERLDLMAFVSTTAAPAAAPTNTPAGSPAGATTNTPAGSPAGATTNTPAGSPTRAPSDSTASSTAGSPTRAPSNAPSNAPSDSPAAAPASSLGGRTLTHQVVRVRKQGFTPDRDFVVRPRSAIAGLRHENLVVARVRPRVPSRPQPIESLLVLLDTSASRAVGFHQQVQRLGHLVQALRRSRGDALRLRVACFDQVIFPVYDGPARDFGPAHLRRILQRRALGASDLHGALRWAARQKGARRLLLITDGVATAGHLESDRLRLAALALKPTFRRLDVIAVGGIREQGLLARLARGNLARDGLVLDGEAPAAEIARRLGRSTVSGVPVSVPGARWVWPPRLDGVQPGQQRLIYVDLPPSALAPGKPLPVRLGQAPAQQVPLQPVARPLLQRAWVKARMARIQDQMDSLALGDRDLRAALSRQLVTLSKRHRVLCDDTALLVLRSEADYRRYGIERKALSDILTIGADGLEVRHRGPQAGGPATSRTRPGALRRRDGASGRRVPPTPTRPATRAPTPRKPMGRPDRLAKGSGRPRDVPILRGLPGAGRARGAPRRRPAHPARVRRRPRPMAPARPPGHRGAPLNDLLAKRSSGARAGAGTRAGAAAERKVRRRPRVSRSGSKAGPRAPATKRRRPGAAAARPLASPPGSTGRAGAGGRSPAGGRSSSLILPDDPGRPPRGERRPPGGDRRTLREDRRTPRGDRRGRTAPPARRKPWSGKLLRVKRLLRKKKVSQALVAALRWRTAAPGDVLALLALGETLEAAGALALAARTYGSIMDLYPSRADLRRHAGQRLERLGKAGWALAADTYARAAAQRPDHPGSHRLLAWALVKLGEYRAAFAALERGLRQRYRRGNFPGVGRILREDLRLIAAAWIHRNPDARTTVLTRLERHGLKPAHRPSLRFVLYWETDANDVDFHVHDARGGHAYFRHPQLPSGGQLYADVTTGYGPECFAMEGVPRAFPYYLKIHYFRRGPMGYGMGKVETLWHDGKGGLTFRQLPFAVMNDGAFLNLGNVERAISR